MIYHFTFIILSVPIFSTILVPHSHFGNLLQGCHNRRKTPYISDLVS
nr:MAG TPA: hypothetical protein [Bacteriophage sp.]